MYRVQLRGKHRNHSRHPQEALEIFAQRGQIGDRDMPALAAHSAQHIWRHIL